MCIPNLVDETAVALFITELEPSDVVGLRVSVGDPEPAIRGRRIAPAILP